MKEKEIVFAGKLKEVPQNINELILKVGLAYPKFGLEPEFIEVDSDGVLYMNEFDFQVSSEW